ncbi:hypothetical protein YC2023_114977 [Brassica napus]
MANLLSDEPATNSIISKVIIHVINVQESLGLDGLKKKSKTDLFGPNGETDKILAKGKDGFRPGLKGTCYLRVNKSLFRWTCASYQAAYRNPYFVGLVRHIKQQLKSGSIKRLSAPLVSPFNPPVLPFDETYHRGHRNVTSLADRLTQTERTERGGRRRERTRHRNLDLDLDLDLDHHHHETTREEPHIHSPAPILQKFEAKRLSRSDAKPTF